MFGVRRSAFGVQGSEVQRSTFNVQRSAFRGSRFRVQRFGVQGSRFNVPGSGFEGSRLKFCAVFRLFRGKSRFGRFGDSWVGARNVGKP
jgi:hypothetical protein